MTTIDYQFAIGDEVRVKGLNVSGFVIALFTGEFGNQYEVAYFYEGDLRKEYLFDFQIETPTKSCKGFLND